VDWCYVSYERQMMSSPQVLRRARVRDPPQRRRAGLPRLLRELERVPSDLSSGPSSPTCSPGLQ
jgi:hypothetical protein